MIPPLRFDSDTAKFVFVYSVSGWEGSLRDQALRSFANLKSKRRFKDVLSAEEYESSGRKADRLVLFGTPDSHPLLAQALRELGLSFEAGSARLGDRIHKLQAYDFEALYRDRGRILVLLTGSSAADISGIDLSPPEGGGYRLRVRGESVAEEGRIESRARGYALVPGALPPDETRLAAKGLEEALQRGIADAWVLPSGKEDFSFIDRIALGKRILFLGESPHYVPALHEAELGIAKRCALLGYRVLALEQVYSLWPYLEAESSGGAEGRAGDAAARELLAAAGPRIGELVKPFVDELVAYNRVREARDGLLLTAVDIDHAINHTKPLTEAYVAYLASASRSAEARDELTKAGAGLRGLSGLAEVEAFLDGLERLFKVYRPSIAPDDYEEIRFSLGLERASIRYQLSDPAKAGTKAVEEIRGAYFRETIERAYAKALAKGGGLVCVVGGAHATLRDFAQGDCLTGRISEARHFATEFGPTAGAVASLGLVKLGADGAYIGDSLSLLAQRELGKPGAEGARGIFLDLAPVGAAVQEALRDAGSPAARRVLQRALGDQGFSAFFSGERPKLDAVFFVR